MSTLVGALTALGLALGLASVLLLYTPLGEGPLTALLPVGEPAPVDFATLAPSDKPNQYLACPPGFCTARTDGVSPVLAMPVAELRARWRGVLAVQPRISLLRESADGMQADYVQRSARFRFPDVITVRFIPLGAARSTLAVYSRSLYGRSDFGVNRARAETWLTLLGEGP